MVWEQRVHVIVMITNLIEQVMMMMMMTIMIITIMTMTTIINFTITRARENVTNTGPSQEARSLV